MKRSIRQILQIILVAPLTLHVSIAGAQQTATPLAIRNVTVVPMDREVLLRGHTVVTRGGLIEAVGPDAAIEIPEGAEVIDGSGRFLIPGLADMHIHVVGGVGEAGDGAWQQMSLLVANGVTTARSLAGAPTGPTLRDGIEAGRLIGPHLYLAGPSLNYQSVTTPAAARAAVREQVADGFDVIKTHGVTGDVYAAMAEEAARLGIPLSGHVTPDYGLHRALQAEQQIEHLDGYLLATIPEDASVTRPPGQIYLGPELDFMRTSAMPDLAARTVDAGVWNSPTLALFEIVADPQPVDAYLDWPEMRYVPENARRSWASQLAQVAESNPAGDRAERFLELRRAMTRALRDAGAGLMAGSDSPQFFLAPGFALHHELRALQNAGLTPYEALASATVNPARYLGPSANFGTIQVGRQADLLLLDANPLENVGNASRISGIVIDGSWLSPAEIDSLKAEVARAAN